MTPLLVWLLPFVFEMVSTQAAAAQEAPRPAPPPLAYMLTLRPGPEVEVELRTAAEPDGTTELCVDEFWGGVGRHAHEIDDLEVVSEVGEVALDRQADHRWVARSAPGALLTVRYTLAEDPDRAPAGRGNDYRTQVGEGLFHAIGTLALVAPTGFDTEAPTEIGLAWQGFEDQGWTTVSSFGPGAEPVSVTLPISRFRHALFLAGDIRMTIREIEGNRVGIAIAGTDWGFEDEQLADLTVDIIRAERDFFADHTDPWFLVSLKPEGSLKDGSFSLGGTGLTNCFAMFVNAGITLDEGSEHRRRMAHLLAHEYFHKWNGGKISTTDPEGSNYWFSEGFTEFYARRILLRAGLATAGDFAEGLNEMLGRWSASPARNATNARVVEEFWTNADVGHLPYQRGELIAIAIDERIRADSGGTACLDDLMRDLLARAREPGEALTGDSILAMIEARTDAEFVAGLRAWIDDGADLPLCETVSEPPLRLASRTMSVFDAGFDTAATQAAMVMSGVREGTAAHAAGLRDGQTVRGLNISSGTPAAPPFATVTIEREGEKVEITYDPVTPPAAVPFYTAR
jgi:predicted metalloprotease with PDZ domain